MSSTPLNITTVLSYTLKNEFIGTINRRSIATVEAEIIYHTAPRVGTYNQSNTPIAGANNTTYYLITITTANPHNCNAGQLIYVNFTGVTSGAAAPANGNYSVVTVVSNSQIQISIASAANSIGTVIINDMPLIDDYSYPLVYQKSIIPITLNEYPFGSGRVISISEPRSLNFDENGLQFWKKNITLEIELIGNVTGSVPNTASNTFYARLNDVLQDRTIREISEDFNFTDDESGNLGYTHTVSVSCDETYDAESGQVISDAVSSAKLQAAKLIESEVDFGYIGNLANLYGKAGKRTFATDVDVTNAKVTITKTFTPFLFSYPAKYSFSVQDDGSIDISESMTFKNKDLATKVNLIGGIKSILDNAKNGAFTRCKSYFDVYKIFITKGNQSVDNFSVENYVFTTTSNIAAGSNIVNVASTIGLSVGQVLTKTSGSGVFGANPVVLNIINATSFTVNVNHITTGNVVFNVQVGTISLISVNRTFDEESQEYSQQITFSNSRNLRSTYTVEINQTISCDGKGVFTIDEDGSLISKSKKQNGTELPFLAPGASSSYVKDTLKTEQGQSIFRAIKLYNTHNGTSISANPDVTPLKLISYSRTGSSNGKEFSYSVSFSNDPSFIRDGTINTINSKMNASMPKKIVKTYIVPGYLNKNNVFSQENDQSSPGSLTITQSIVLKRTESNKTPDLVNKPTSAITSAYNRCLTTLYNRVSNFGLGDPNNLIINSLSFSYNSSRGLEMNVGSIYFVAANRFGRDLNLYQN